VLSQYLEEIITRIIFAKTYIDDSPTFLCQTAKYLALVYNLNAGQVRQSGFPRRIRDFLSQLFSWFSFFILIVFEFGMDNNLKNIKISSSKWMMTASFFNKFINFAQTDEVITE